MSPALPTAQPGAVLVLGGRTGLVDTRLTALARDSSDFLWLASHAGLQRWDGHRLTPPVCPASAPLCTLVSLTADDRGGLWVIDAQAGLFHKPPESMALAAVALPAAPIDLAFAEGALWVATSSGLLRLAGPSSAEPPEVLLAGVALLAVSPDARWVASDDALWRLDAPHSPIPLSSPPRARGLKLTSRGEPLLLLAGGGVRVLAADSPALLPTQVESLVAFDAVSRGEETWLATSDGVFSLSLTAGNSGIAAQRLHSAYTADLLDDFPLLWIASANGLSKALLEPPPLSALRFTPPVEDVTALRIDGEQLFLGSLDGLRRYDAGRATGHWLGGRHVTAIEGCGGALYAGTFADGLYRLDGRDARPLTVRSSVHDDHGVTALACNESVLWVGTYDQGLWRVTAAGEPQPELVLAGASYPKIHALLPGVRGRLWLSSDQSLYTLSNARQAVPIRRHEFSSRVRSLLTSGSALWVGLNSGLERCGLEGSTANLACDRAWGADEGLEGSRVVSLFLDAQAVLWLTTTSALHRLDPTSGVLQSVPESLGHPAQSWYPNAVARRADGEFLLGAETGAYLLRPASPFFRQAPARLDITAVLVDGQDVAAPAGRIRLGHNQDLQLHFALMDYARRPVLYSYRLADQGPWSDPSPFPLLALPALGVGDHLVQLRAIGVGTTAPTTLHIQVAPPFFRSPTAYLLYALVALLLLAAWVRQTTVRLQRLREARNRALTQQASALEEASVLSRQYTVATLHDHATNLPLVQWLFRVCHHQFEEQWQALLSGGSVAASYLIAIAPAGVTQEAIGQGGLAAVDALLSDLARSLRAAAAPESFQLARDEGAAFVALSSEHPAVFAETVHALLASGLAGGGPKVEVAVGWTSFLTRPTPGHALLTADQALVVARAAARYAIRTARETAGFELGPTPAPADALLRAVYAGPSGAQAQGLLAITLSGRRRDQSLRPPLPFVSPGG